MRLLARSLLLASVLFALPSALSAQRLHGTLETWETSLVSPYDIEVAADGKVWMTHDLGVVRLDPATGLSQGMYPLGTDKQIQTLDIAGDGMIWIADANERIFRLDPATLVFTTYAIPAATFPGGCGAFGIQVAPGGDVFFACMVNRSIGRLQPAGPTWTRYGFGAGLPDSPMEIAFDDAGVAWFTIASLAGGTPGFGWLDPAHPASAGWLSSVGFYRPHGIVFSGGYIWFADHSWDGADSQLVRVDRVTHAHQDLPIPGADDCHYLAVDDHGRLYTAGYVTSSLAMYDPATGDFQSLPLPGNAWPMAVAFDAAGRLWYADVGTGGEGGAGRFTPWGPDALAIGVRETVGSGPDQFQGAVAAVYGTCRVGLSAGGNQLWTEDNFGVEGDPEDYGYFGDVVAAGDFDGDGAQDLAIGAPQKSSGSFGFALAGEVHVFYGWRGRVLSSLRDEIWHQDRSGVLDESEEEDQFGSALAVGDFDRDGFDDLAIGVPGEGVGAVATAGAVAVLHGSASGLTATGDQFWSQDSASILESAETFDWFGTALAAGDFDHDGFDDLAIGAPGEDVGGVDNVGVVQALYGGPDGLAWSGNQLWQQGAGIQDYQESGDAFGETLAVGEFNGDGYDDLAIGVPGEEVDGVTGAGAVAILRGAASGLAASSNQLFDQTGSLQDGLETNDHFGTALATGDFDGDGYDDLAVGVPWEAVGAVEDAGAVNVLYGTSTGLLATGSQFLHQNTSGVPGGPETGDRFGWSLASGDFDDDGFTDLAVGAPYEDVGVTDDGAVWILRGTLGGVTGSGSWMVSQGTSGIEGALETSDRFGWSLVAVGGLADGPLFSDDFETGATGRWSRTEF